MAAKYKPDIVVKIMTCLAILGFTGFCIFALSAAYNFWAAVGGCLGGLLTFCSFGMAWFGLDRESIEGLHAQVDSKTD